MTFKRVKTSDRNDELFQRYWIERLSLSEIADLEDVSRQAVSQRLRRRNIKTYSDFRYSPRGVRRWDFENDTLPLKDSEKSVLIENSPLKDLVGQVGPIETALVLEHYGQHDDTTGAVKSQRPPDDVMLYAEAWDHLIDALGDPLTRKQLWKSSRHHWDYWWNAFRQDPLPRWAIGRSMDVLAVTQSTFSDYVGWEPRTVRKWTNAETQSKACRDSTRLDVIRGICRMIRDEISEQNLDDVAESLKSHL
jgi:hypothetical protein